MDRVLVAFDQIQLAVHVETTLRKVGYDVETIANEFNLSERLLTFNPDIVLVRGNSPKLMTMNVGRKLKENTKYNGKVVLVFPADHKISPEDMSKIKVDLLLFEPLGALQLVMKVLQLEPERKEVMQERLLKMAQTDQAFRQQEQSYLVQHGVDINTEIIKVQGTRDGVNNSVVVGSQGTAIGDRQFLTEGSSAASADVAMIQSSQKPEESARQNVVSEEYKKSLQAQLIEGQAELELRIDSYNNQIEKIDKSKMNLEKSLKARQTRKIAKGQRAEFLVDPGQEKLDSLDKEKQKFVTAMFKKK